MGGRGFSSAQEQLCVFWETGQPFSSEPATQHSGQKQCPALLHGPSLSDGLDLVQLVADDGDGACDEVAFFMQNADFDRALAAALDLAGDSGHEHGAGADGFAVVAFIVKAQVEAPPVVNKGDEVCHKPAGGEAAGGIAAPAPLVLEFVEAVFGIGTVAVVLGHHDGRIGAGIEAGDEHGDLAAPRGGAGVPAFAAGLRQVTLPVFAATRFTGQPDRRGAWGFTHENDAPLFAPAAEAQGGFKRLPAVAAVLPIGSLTHHADDEVFDFGGVAEFEEVRKLTFLVLQHDGLAAVAAIAAGAKSHLRPEISEGSAVGHSDAF